MTHASIKADEVLIQRAKDLALQVRAFRSASDDLRQLAPEAFDAVRRSGLLRLLIPKRYGGLEASMTTIAACLAHVAEGCPSAAWCIMIANSTAWHFGRREEPIQDEIFSNPDVVISGAISPGGEARRVEGGWIVSGRYPFLSFVHHADWVFFPILYQNDEGGTDLLSLYCPSSDVTLLDNWHTLGMKGTGSTDGLLEDVFVRDARVVRNEDRNAITPASLRHATNMYKMPVICVLPLLIGAVALGTARRGLDVSITSVRGRIERYSGRQKEQSQAVHIRHARAAAKIEAAGLMLQDAAALYDERCEADQVPSLSERARIKWFGVSATDMLRQSVNELFDGAGGSAIYDANEMQGVFRNIHTASHHAVCDIDPAAETYGRVLLGQPFDERIV